jgi:hypothetical protein
MLGREDLVVKMEEGPLAHLNILSPSSKPFLLVDSNILLALISCFIILAITTS